EPSATVFRRVHPDEQDLLAAEIAAAVEAGVRVDFTHRVILDDGSTRWIEGRGGPVRDATGEVRAITGVAGDVTLKRLSELQAEGERARLQLALAAGGMGMWEWDPGTGAAQWSDPLGGEPTESSLEAWLERVHPDDRNRVANVFKDAVRMRSEFVHEYRITDRDGAVRWIEARGRPVVAADGNLRVVGVASDVSNRKAQEARVRRKSRLLETLNEVGRAITARLDLDEVVQMVTDAGRVLTGARFAVFLHNAEDGEGGYDVSALSGLHPGQVASLGRPRRTGVFEATLREQRTVRVADITADHRFGQNAPIHGLPAGHPPVRSYLGVPVLGGDGEVFGALLFGHPAPDRFDEPSEALATGLAAQAAVAIENARLYAAAKREIGARRQALEERDRVVHELQRSLLPPNLPSGPGITFGAHFRSGSGPVGGDFYDAFPLGEVDWGIVVGDVCGKGNEAAAVTALARHTVRMAAVMAPEPERVLDLLNDALLRDDSDRFCAASFARLHVEADSVVGVLSLAGHPPARIVRRDGDVVTIPSTTGMVLGIVDEPPIGSAPVRLDPGDVLVVCTDGVTEAPGDTERFGDDRLDALLASSAGRSAQEVADAVVAAVDDFEVGAGRDDVAVLVVGVPLGDV
ncbi:MAG TPA: SpoIIE family protein phosphatase, partial [Acidimicrobiia bacterium]|nr:SpoIIE family protein phosphatase [Acidimicrobiia bacterium]